MTRTKLVSLLLATVAVSGCAKIKDFLDKRAGRNRTAQQQQQATPTAADSQKAATQTQQAPPPRTIVTNAPPRPLQDEPYNPTDTGTIQPGMSERDIYTIWGQPVAVRRMGEMTYMFYKNGCEFSCGTHDVVILRNDQVVDAITRHPGHRYAGVSSSPPGRIPAATKSGDTLQVRPQSP